MTVEYELTLEDLIAFNMYHFEHSPTMRRQLLQMRLTLSAVTVVLVLVVIYIMRQSLGETGMNLPSQVIAGGAGLILFLIYPRFARSDIRKRSAKLLREGQAPGSTGRVQLTLLPEGLLSRSRSGESLLRWSATEKLVMDEQHLLLYYAPLLAVIVPRRAFASAADEQQFIEAVKRYQSAGVGAAG